MAPTSSNGSGRPAGITRRRLLAGFVAAAAATTLGACAPAPAPTSQPVPPPAATQPPPKPAATQPPPKPAATQPAAKPAPTKPAAQAPAKPKQMTKLTLAQAVTAMAFAPVVLAKDAGFFAAEGIELDHQIAGSAANSLAALTSGEAHLMAGGGDTILSAFEKNLDVLSIAGVTTSNLFSWSVSKSFAEKRGVTRQSPLAERVAGLKGARVGTATIAGIGTRLGKYVLQQSGFDPESHVEFVQAGTGAALAAALREGQVDAIFNGIPDPEFVEDEGFGMVLIVLAEDFPFTRSFIHNAMATKKSWADANPELAQRAARAIGRACNHILSDFENSKKVLQGAFPALKPSVLHLALTNAKPAFAKDARMNEVMWKNTIEVYRSLGGVTMDIAPAEGRFWTNRYLVDVPQR